MRGIANTARKTRNPNRHIKARALVFLAIAAFINLLSVRAEAFTRGGTYDLVQILSDQRVRHAINMAEVGEIKKLGDGTYQVVYGHCVLTASVIEECTQIPDPPSCQQKVQFNPEHVNCKP